MHIFAPTNMFTLLVCLGLLVLVVLAGYSIIKIRNYAFAITLAWVLLLTAVVFMERFTAAENAGFRMLVIILATLFCMKAPVTVEAYKNREKRLSFTQWLAFAVGWFGMRPGLFETLGRNKLPGAGELIWFGLSRIIMGSLLLASATWLASGADTYFQKFLFTALLLLGISLVLHFGILNISAGVWRFAGADTRTLFRAPLLSTSLTEFWGKRWNIAFSEMTALAIYRPLKNRLGTTFATLLAFLFSGLLHELAISVPVKTGYGLPLLYFAIHGCLMIIERALEKRGVPISDNKIFGRAWVIFWLLLPLPILFHKAFIKEILWPLIGQ